MLILQAPLVGMITLGLKVGWLKSPIITRSQLQNGRWQCFPRSGGTGLGNLVAFAPLR